MYALKKEEELYHDPSTELRLVAEAPAAVQADLLSEAALERRSVHIGAAWATAAIYAALILVYWVTFGGNRSSAFMVAISSGFAVAFFAVPWFALRSRKAFLLRSQQSAVRQRTFSEFLDGPVDTANGICSGREAMVQILTVPLCLLAATAAFAAIWAFV